ncbi:unnamed protein product [Rotaria socialis]|uniref:Uncharacterized protein n=1 Tax=Rotaria socialis TaxID=392032 RepID=A0A821TWT3_9BILA|nr:unnamed protein product [Rotaria socialis]CAF4876788.1 unnamed protein product [Rotaria socialis]
MTHNKTSSLIDFAKNKYECINLIDQFQEREEYESDIYYTDDALNESNCSISILATGTFPRCQSTSSISYDSFTQSNVLRVSTPSQVNDFLDDYIIQQTTEPKQKDMIKNGSSGSIDRQVPPTPSTGQSDYASSSPISSISTRRQRCRTRQHPPQIIQRSAYDLPKRTEISNRCIMQRYLHRFKCLTNRVNLLYKKLTENYHLARLCNDGMFTRTSTTY